MYILILYDEVVPVILCLSRSFWGGPSSSTALADARNVVGQTFFYGHHRCQWRTAPKTHQERPEFRNLRGSDG